MSSWNSSSLRPFANVSAFDPKQRPQGLQVSPHVGPPQVVQVQLNRDWDRAFVFRFRQLLSHMKTECCDCGSPKCMGEFGCVVIDRMAVGLSDPRELAQLTYEFQINGTAVYEMDARLQ